MSRPWQQASCDYHLFKHSWQACTEPKGTELQRKTKTPWHWTVVCQDTNVLSNFSQEIDNKENGKHIPCS